MHRRGLAATAAATIALTSGGLVAAAPSQAAGSCTGTKLTTMTHKNVYSGNVVAKTGLYDNGSQICAVTVKQGNLYGTESYVQLTLIKSGTPNKVDAGRFKYQAGPVRKAKGGGCVTFDVFMKSPDGSREIVQDFSYRCS